MTAIQKAWVKVVSETQVWTTKNESVTLTSVGFAFEILDGQSVALDKAHAIWTEQSARFRAVQWAFKIWIQ